jgi:hypothetical protein
MLGDKRPPRIPTDNEVNFLRSQGSFKQRPGDRAMQPLRDAVSRARVDAELARIGVKPADQREQDRR